MAIKRKESEKRDEEKQTVKSKSRVSASSRPSKKVAKVPEKKDDGKKATKPRTTTKRGEEPKTRDAPTKKVLGNLPVTTELYTGADVDALLEASRLIEDEDIPGDFYMISIKSGRLIVRKIQEQP